MAFEVKRHKTAITRYELSKPLRTAIQDSLITEGKQVFDYGCGKGDDVRELKKMGFQPKGWDPYFYPKNKIEPAEVVNLGYVLNVIEEPSERAEALYNAYELAKEALVVSVMLDSSSNRA